MTKPILVILGPTAVGKSSLGMEMARRLGGEIINADALQVYKHLEIGTAKPTLEHRREIPHHLVDLLEPSDRFSAGDFARRARQAVTEIENRGHVPIVVGGSGLYLRALLEGLSAIPRGDEALRGKLAQRLDSEGLPVLHEELRRLDPETAERLAPADRQRILRALEVFHTSGRPLSEWIREQPIGHRPLRAFRIGLTLPRSILYDRIAERVLEMIEQGWVHEIEGILEKGVDPEAPAFQAIGYRQLVRYLSGELNLEDALNDIIRATRRYAKRQMTWFRKEKDIRWVSVLSATEEAIHSLLHDFRVLEEHTLNEQA